MPWDHRLASGRTLWEELQYRNTDRVTVVEQMAAVWAKLADKIDGQRHTHVSMRLAHQVENAQEWRDVCLGYFGQFADS